MHERFIKMYGGKYIGRIYYTSYYFTEDKYYARAAINKDHFFVSELKKRCNLSQQILILPAMSIRKKNDKWVHLDTEKETYLSEIVGRAIEDFQSPKRVSIER